LFVLDNVDPKTIQSTYKQIQQDDPSQQHTVVCVISKSGETIEIASNLMVALQKLPRATYVAITGRTGSLRSFAEDQGWPTLDVPEGVGGRFSVLSQVGLFPAAMCGIDISSMLDGANAMAEHCNKPENMASILARYLIGHTIDLRPMHIMMPYCDSLVQCTHWWVQLWAESLGKLNKNTVRVGPTPIAAIGATDQHSVLQLWREGPADKVIGFIHVQEGDDLDLGKRVLFDTTPWLGNKTMREVLTAEQQATAEAVADGDQPTWTLSLEQVSPHTIGQLFALWELTTAYAGNLLQIDPYTQPGVELGKQLTVEKLTTG
jgi:glucose-6-phosphate isomerase